MMAKRILLEICVASVEDALAAESGGADRLELNCALALGGLTPSLGLFSEVRRAVSLPIIAMIRPRPGGFCYTSAEFDVMWRDADMLLAAGAKGLAFGILTHDGEIDSERNQSLRNLCDYRDAVFHRAFDWTRDPIASLNKLIELKFNRVMTSGQAATALEGVPLITELVRQSNGQIGILPAAGINPLNAGEILARTGCNQVHASSRLKREDASMPMNRNVRFHSKEPIAEDALESTDAELVAQLRSLLGS